MKINKIKLQMVREKEVEYKQERIHNENDIVKFINEIEEINLLVEESVYLLCLNTKNEIVSYSEIAKGGISFCNFDMKTLFKNILLSNASKFILVHNHPSGDCTPSKSDINITKKIKDASKLMDIDFLDHIVIAENSYSSCFCN